MQKNLTTRLITLGVTELMLGCTWVGQYNLIRFSLMHSLPLEPLAIVMCLETPLWTPGSRVSSLFSGESGRLRGLGDIVILPGWNMGPEAGGSKKPA